AALAENLLGLALDGSSSPVDRRLTTLAAFEYRWSVGDLPQAEVLLRSLLAESLADEPGPWRLAGRLAEQRAQESTAAAALERALALEYRQLPETVDLQGLRQDYGRLLNHYRRMADAAAELHAPPPADLVARTVRAADRWRALDPEKAAPCQA